MGEKLHKKTFILLALLGLFNLQTSAQEFAFDDNAAFQLWNVGFGAAARSHAPTDGILEGGVQGALKLERSGNNNANIGYNQGIDASTKKIIKVRFKNETAGTSIRIQGSQDSGSTIKIANTVFTISAVSSDYVTMYLDMTGVTNWDNTVDNFDLLVRSNAATDATGSAFYLDEIEFLDAIPATEYSEFVQNPSFEDPTGTDQYTGDFLDGDREVINIEGAKNGIGVLRYTYTQDATANHFTFTNYAKTYGSLFPVGTVLQVKMWVKTNRAAAIKIMTRIKTENTGTASSKNESKTITTTNTSMDWEQLTFDLPITETSDKFTNWIGIIFDSSSTDLKNGDVIFIDNIEANIFPVETSTTDGTWESSLTWGGTSPDQGDLKTIDNNVTINSAVVSDGPVTINAGKTLTITTGNSLTLNSDLTTNDGLVLEPGAQLIVTGNATGNATYQRTLISTDNGAGSSLEGWFSVSPPVSGEALNTAWADANSLASGTVPNRGIATYTEATGNWSYFDGTATTFEAGKGYIVKRASDGMISFTGSINTSDDGVSIAVTKTGNGYNLLGNPYTSVINSATFLADNTSNLEVQQIWIWNDNGNTYDSKTAGMNFKVAPGQAFFVQANAAATLNFAESNQEVGADTFQRSSETKIKLTVDDGQIHRYAEVYYIQNKTLGYDIGYEGEVFGGIQDDFSLYTHILENNQGEKYQIQTLPNDDLETMIVPVGVKAEAGKEITFSAEALNLPTDMKVFLEDKQENTFVRLDEVNAEYSVTLSENLDGIGRFYIHTSRSALSIDDAILNTISIYKSSENTLRVTGLSQGNTTVKLFNVLGEQILSNSFSTNNGVQDVHLPKLATGVYITQVETEAGKINKKIILE